MDSDTITAPPAPVTPRRTGTRGRYSSRRTNRLEATFGDLLYTAARDLATRLDTNLTELTRRAVVEMLHRYGALPGQTTGASVESFDDRDQAATAA